MAHLFLKGGAIVSMDPAVGTLARGDLLVAEGRIAAIGPALEAPEGAQTIDAAGMIVMPGFVNAHMHTWQTALKGIAADWTIQEYLRAMHAGLATHFRPDDIYIANLVGALNQLACGTTTLVDWCHNNPTPEHTEAAIDGLEEAGIRALFLHGSPKPDPKEGQKHFSEIPLPRAEIERLRRDRFTTDDRLVTCGLAILGPGMSVYEVAETDLRLARELDIVASMHVSGPMLVPDGFERLCALGGMIGSKTNIVHGNAVADDCLAMLVDHGASFAVTAEVEMQMGFGRPLTNRLRALGGLVSIGSDIESGMSSDMFSVTRFALQCARFLDSLDAISETGRGPASITVGAEEALRWATIDGARMAGLDHKVGSLTPGKQADIVMLRATDLNLFPVADPVASIVLQAGPANVDTVIVAGTTVKRAGRLLHDGLDRRREALAASGARIRTAFGATVAHMKISA
ncbi:amidohydrolase family protein [Faunimonas sp. B44]|uniref:amidohydrolase family protein n=1 Tax=Faunimonas sp. B44 TaxID=3461493 RepID=UPI004044C243